MGSPRSAGDAWPTPLFDPGEWTDDTSQAVVIAEVAATGVELWRPAALAALGNGLLAWYRAGAPGTGLARLALGRLQSRSWPKLAEESILDRLPGLTLSGHGSEE